ncbi:MAG: AmmeMemoRadiSam system protein B [Candidatus Moraniibacteriota bacterium]
MGNGKTFARIGFPVFLFLVAVIACISFFAAKNGEETARPQDTEIVRKTPIPIVSFITPHHLLAEKDIDEVFRTVSEKDGNDSVGRIILVSPNHFGIGKSWVIGSEKDWETPSGMIRSDKVSLDGLRDVAFVSDGIFEREHGIRNILPYIKKYFPRATLVPLALQDGLPDGKADALAERLYRLSDPHTLLVVSADFSHYLDWNFSRFHDIKSLETIRHFDTSHVSSLDIDCVSCVRLAMKFSELRGASNYQPLSRSSALESIGTNKVGQETSHMTGYFSTESVRDASAVDTLQLLFAGPVAPERMTDDARRTFMGQDGNIFEQGGESRMNVFAAAPSGKISSDAVFETGGDVSFRLVGGKKVAFIRTDIGASDIRSIVTRITDAKAQSDTAIVLWKNDPDVRSASGDERVNRARAFVDAGADMAVGTDPLSVGAVEVYKGKLIIPSMGDVSRDGSGLIFGIGFSRETTDIVFMPVVRERSDHVALATGKTRSSVLEALSGHIVDLVVKQSILGGSLMLKIGN